MATSPEHPGLMGPVLASPVPTGPVRGLLRGLVGSVHPGPALAVTVLSGLLAAATGLNAGRAFVVVAAVLAGQLSIGWSNDLIDLGRDRLVGRSDKPLATGAVSVAAVRWACAAALVACVVLSLLCGLLAGLIHLGCVAAGWAYNLGMKSTVWSWSPYAVAFGGLTAFVTLAGTPGAWPPLWLPAAAACLGVGAHLVNVLPDLAADRATGVHGLPHRLGARWIPVVAVTVLAVGSVVTVAGSGLGAAGAVATLVVVAGLAAVALAGRDRLPFVAAVGIALVDVVVLVVGA
jgi:4-hydroxybenzoate polyprenyltransferase